MPSLSSPRFEIFGSMGHALICTDHSSQPWGERKLIAHEEKQNAFGLSEGHTQSVRAVAVCLELILF